MATPTSSSNRSKRKTAKPVTKGQEPNRSNRQKVSTAKVTNSSNRSGNAGSAKVTNSSQRLARGNWETENPKITRGQRGGSFPTGVYPADKPSSKPSSVQRRTRVNGKVKPGMVSRNQVGQPKPQRQGPTTSNVPTRATPQPPAKPSGNFKAPNIPKPKGAAPKPNALTRNLKFGRGNVAAMVLGAANAADDARLTPAQLRKKYETVNPERGQKLLTKFQNGTLGQRDTPRPKQGNAQSRFAGARDANLNRINNDPRFAAPKAQGKPPAKKKPAPGPSPAPSMPRAVTPRQSSPSSTNAPSSSPTLRKGEDQNKNRGSYATKFKEETGRMTAASMVRQQNRGNMTSEDLKPKQNDNIKTNYDGSTNVYEPKTKPAPNYSKAKIDQKKVDEYGRRKKRYYD